MALGFAGEPHLETWIRASIILWMIYYMFVNITAIRAMHQSSRPTPQGKVSATMLLKIFSVAGMALAATGMILIEPEPFQLLMFAIIVVAVLAVIVNSVDFFLIRNRSMRPRQ